MPTGLSELPSDGIEYKGRRFTVSDLRLISEIVRQFGRLSRQELANTVCELLEWRRPNGGLKTWESKALLAELEARGWLQLPPLRRSKPRGSRTRVSRSGQGEAQAPLKATVREVSPLIWRLVQDREERGLWRELVDRYHYLGHCVPFGAHLRYLVEVADPRPAIVACVQLSSPAWKMAARDAWIGWEEATRQRHLQRIVNQSRFLILPWVEVRHLASHLLAQLARRVGQDWEQAYGLEPWLMETLVDARRFSGTCYRAANWRYLGQTTGRGRMDRQHRRHGAAPKRVFVYPLITHAREQLRGK